MDKINNIKNIIASREISIKDLRNKNTRVYNIWRGIRFTKKGKKVGCSEEWKSYINFYNDVIKSYKEGLLFRRLDFDKPYSKDNFIQVTSDEAVLLKSKLVWLEYNGENLPLRDWALKYNLSLYGLRSRYFKRLKYNYTTEEILFGRKKKRNSKIVTHCPTSRSKASKMISSYKHKDKINGVSICDIDIDWMLENITNKPCVYCGDTHRVGCDRIDNTKGHTKDNVVPCCYECNCAKNSNFTYDEMLLIGETIRKIKQNRKII